MLNWLKELWGGAWTNLAQAKLLREQQIELNDLKITNEWHDDREVAKGAEFIKMNAKMDMYRTMLKAIICSLGQKPNIAYIKHGIYDDAVNNPQWEIVLSRGDRQIRLTVKKKKKRG